jgi:hypothetical protein
MKTTSDLSAGDTVSTPVADVSVTNPPLVPYQRGHAGARFWEQISVYVRSNPGSWVKLKDHGHKASALRAGRVAAFRHPDHWQIMATGADLFIRTLPGAPEVPTEQRFEPADPEGILAIESPLNPPAYAARERLIGYANEQGMARMKELLAKGKAEDRARLRGARHRDEVLTNLFAEAGIPVLPSDLFLPTTTTPKD